ncbi:hypothetical protein N836_00845 [Leptolyngbya sp. Heron Island J]|nr:hypothetical protein N836_00845 [Leptolyngbya sp. Heron Island J]
MNHSIRNAIGWRLKDEIMLRISNAEERAAVLKSTIADGQSIIFP